jgi:hydrogenase maturation protein HypF
LLRVIADRLAGRSPQEIAYAFHAALAEELVRQALHWCGERNLRTIVLSGGVFQNDLLFELMLSEITEHADLRVVTNQMVPVNDGGLCLGQAALAMSPSGDAAL